MQIGLHKICQGKFSGQIPRIFDFGVELPKGGLCGKISPKKGETDVEHDLIAAVATGEGRSAIGIIRISGPGAAACAGTVFTPKDGKPLWEKTPGKLVYGTLRDSENRPLDHILATWSPAGRSYTGEETAELQCHGSPMVLSMAMEALFAHGARQAGPGEFTRRAFLNGRLDLTQAEAVMDLIDASSPAAARQAAGQLSGALFHRVEEVYDGLVDVMAHFHAVLDYPDEDLDPFTAQTVEEALEKAGTGLTALLDTYGRGRVVREGIPTAIVGRPNVGKSTLLNALVGYERAIVTDIPGTTRDTVEETCVLGGVLLRLIDTAGLRETADPVELLGVERSRQAMEQAELIFAVVDMSADLTAEDGNMLRAVSESGKPWILVASKKDLVKNSCSLGLVGGDTPPVEVSALTGEGLDRLGEVVAELFPQGAGETAGDLLTNARQAEAAARAKASVDRAMGALRAGVTPDALLTDVEEALAALGELTGKTVREDVTDRIFQRFCVGK